jgi:O-antigen/teichoic acid export membrane protein
VATETTIGSSGARDARRLIVRGSAWNTLAWVVTNLTGAVNAIFLVRSMRHPEFGIYVMAAALIGIVSAVSSLGLGPAILQLAPRVPGGAASVLHTALRVSKFLGAIAAACVAGACIGLVAAHEVGLALALAIMIPLAIASPFTASWSGYLQSTHQPKRLARALLVSPIVLTSAVVALCLLSHPAASWVAGARTGAVLAMSLALAVAVRRAIRPPRTAEPAIRRSLDPEEAPDQPDASVRQLTALGGSLLGGTLGAILLAQLDVVILGFERGHASVAFYGPASQIADNTLTMAATIGTFYLSTIAGVIAGSRFAEARELYRWAARWTLVWVAPVIAVAFACPASLLSLLFGNDYARMATPLRILTAGVVINVLFGFNGITVDSLNNLRIIIGRQAVGAAFNVVACLVLIPIFGTNGAAAATSSSLLVINVVASIALFRHTGISPVNPKLIAPAAALVLAVGLGIALRPVALPDLARVAVVAAAAAVLCFLASYTASAPSERRTIKSGIRRQLRVVTRRQPSTSAA